MSSSDFDDIFGDDPKMDATAAPTLTNVNLDDIELFGGAPTGKVTKAAESTGEQRPQGSNWEQIGSREQDEFLSWLDDGGSSQAAPLTDAPVHVAPVPSNDFAPPPAPVQSDATSTFESVALDDNDEFDRMLDSGNTESSSATPALQVSINAPSSTSLGDSDDLDKMLESTSTQPSLDTFTPVVTADSISPGNDDLDQMLSSAATQAHSSMPTSAGSISLDDDDDLDKMVRDASKLAGSDAFLQTAPVGSISLDDDDDDDYLERIVQKASKQANASGSRENSSSSLQIKSQVQAQHKAQIGTKIHSCFLVIFYNFLINIRFAIRSRCGSGAAGIPRDWRDPVSLSTCDLAACCAGAAVVAKFRA
ncbi:unnamed protein product [Phytophthora lilii]|uniref:Unnamed protein product n=1 Tax=Phytophthora lilii TaxID=2077276 RepID=A0A9W6TEN6_9STRA|nr:unnamed protein product [Phytophthora lilii]